MILINGVPGDKVSVYDRGLHYGDGLFETIAVKNGEIRHWALHWQRFIHGCQRLNMSAPEEATVLEEINTVLDNAQQAVIKLIFTRGSGGRGYGYSDMQHTRIVFCYPWPEFDSKNYHGISLYLCETRLSSQPRLAGIKHLNRLENILARNEWNNNQFAEGLMLSTNNHVIEGTMSNIFWCKDGQLYTPQITECGVNGVARQHILTLATEIEIQSTIGDFHVEDLLQADEAFVCNSLIGLWPVKSFQNKHYDVEENANLITRKLTKYDETNR